MPPVQDRYKELRLEQLRAFAACVRHRSFSAAARALAVSQPALWQQVRALERRLGAELLRRRGRDLAPSEDGILLLDLAAPLLGSVDALQQTFQQRREEVPRRLVVIGTPGIVSEELARPVARFCRKYPHVELTLLNYAGLRTLDALTAGEADLAVLPLAAEIASQRQLVVAEVLGRRDWALAVRHDHPLAKKRRIGLADIVPYPLILPERDSNWRKRIEELLQKTGLLIQLKVVLEVSITLAARRFVGLGLGIALAPLPRFSMSIPGVVTRPLPDLLPPEEIVALRRRGQTPSPQARRFTDFVKRQLNDC